MKPKTALVTGGAGFIGSHLVDKLISLGWTVIVVDDLSSGQLKNIEAHLGKRRFEFYKIDLYNKKDVLRIVRNIDVIFHFAANPEVRVSSIDPEIHFRENIVTTFNILEAMRVNDIGELIFASSSSVYGEPDTMPVEENSPVKPISVYGATKASCENLIHAYMRLYGFRAVALRYANVVGPRLTHGVIYDFILKLLNNPHKLEILGDGTQVRSYIYIDDAINATLVAYEKSQSHFDVYNVASNDWITVNDVAQMVVEVMNLKNVKFVYKPMLHGVGWLGDVKHVVLSIDKIRKLGWKPNLDSRQAVKLAAKKILAEIKSRSQ